MKVKGEIAEKMRSIRRKRDMKEGNRGLKEKKKEKEKEILKLNICKAFAVL